VRVSLPQFEIRDARVDLRETLCALGVELPFDDERADFGDICASPDPALRLYVSDALHAAFARVNEAGTEAAAATAVSLVIRGGRLRDRELVPFVADHPFAFAIRDRRSGATLLLGRFTGPGRPPR
jgi:serpin B